ncbi:RHS repeat domain-containing protein [Sphingomonas sp. MMS24-JH45]
MATTRSHTAFGELASETDARGAVTSYAYNRMGRVLTITRPQVTVTDEDGQARTLAPVERRYHDIGGRLRRVARRQPGAHHPVAGAQYGI